MAASFDPAKARLLQTVRGDPVGYWSIAFDPAGHRVYAGGTDFGIHPFDLPSLRPAKGVLKGHASYVTALAYLAPLRVLVSGGWDKQLVWWGATGEVIRRVDAGARVNRLAASADGGRIAGALDDLVARVWDARTGKPVVAQLTGGHPATTEIGRRNTLYAVALSPDGRRLASADRAGTVCVWDVAGGRLVVKAEAGAFYSQALYRTKLVSEYEWGGVRSLAFAPDGKVLVAGGMGPADMNSAGIDGPMRLEAFDAATGKSLAAVMGPSKGFLNAITFLPSGDWLVAGGGGGQAGSAGVGSLWFWDYRRRGKDGKPVPPVEHRSDAVIRDLAVSPDGSRVLCAGMFRDVTAGRIDVWDLTGKPAPVKK